MGKEKKNPFEGMKRKDLVKFFTKAQKILENAKTTEELEELKRDLIKSYKPIKENSGLMDLNKTRINLLKLCNVNLQFIHRIQDARRMLAQLNIKGAYDEMMAASRAMYSHPDRSHLHEWIRVQIRETLEFVANKKAEEDKRKEKEKQIKSDHTQKTLDNISAAKEPDQTFIPGTGNSREISPPKQEFKSTYKKQPIENKQNIEMEQTIRPSDSNDDFNSPFHQNPTNPETIRPQITTEETKSSENKQNYQFSNQHSPFPPNKTPFPPNKSSFSSNETNLQPQPNSPFENSDQTIKSPFEDPQLREKVFKPGENSIKTFWKRNQDEENEVKDESNEKESKKTLKI